MNDPHVEELIYRVELGEELRIIDPPPVEDETDEFRMQLINEVATFQMKNHHPSEEGARKPVDAYLRAWELDVALRYGHKRKLGFVFDHSNIIDRDPPPTSPPETTRTVPVQADLSLRWAVHALVQLSGYPVPPKVFEASLVEQLKGRRIREGRQQGCTVSTIQCWTLWASLSIP